MKIKKKMKLNSPTFVISREWQLILLFASVKILFHFFTFSNFELHRDAYLYYAQSEHLAWGYISVPPSIAVFGKIATLIFGNTAFGLRFFPALIGGINLIIIGLAVKELGGKIIAISLASLAYLLSFSYLHVSTLFQPVSFNQFYWLLSGYLILVMIRRKNPKIWIWIAIVFGFAFLNKYSIVFFYTAFAISLLVTKHRYLYTSKYFLIALAVGFAIISPNLFWQYQNNWPILTHMSELRETQLVNVRPSDFLLEQLSMNAQSLFIVFGGLLVLLFFKKEKQYRLFGFIYLFIIILLMLGSGKGYYTMGIYPILFVFGAYFFEKYIKKYSIYVFGLLVVMMFVPLYVFRSYSISLTTFEKSVHEGEFRWNDGSYHDINQDLANMTGWKELGQKVSDIYLNLGQENKNNCDIFCYNYGQAGAVMFYGKKNKVPQPISFNGSFVFWAPDSLSKDYMIWVHSGHNDINQDSLLSTVFRKVELKTTIDNKYFRENGTKIYLCESPTKDYRNDYKTRIKELKNRYR
jgi:hypothetical protein